jgi:hypothetical protein
MAIAERPARSDASKEWRYGTSVPLDLVSKVEVNFNFEISRGKLIRGALSRY